MHLISFSVLIATLIALAHAANFAELAAQLPDCDVSSSARTGILYCADKDVATMFTAVNPTIALRFDQHDMSLHRSNVCGLDASLCNAELHGQRVIE